MQRNVVVEEVRVEGLKVRGGGPGKGEVSGEDGKGEEAGGKREEGREGEVGGGVREGEVVW